jgi:hypothetical protein
VADSVVPTLVVALTVAVVVVPALVVEFCSLVRPPESPPQAAVPRARTQAPVANKKRPLKIERRVAC